MSQLDDDAGRRLVVADGLAVIPLSEDEVLIRFGTQSQPAELIRDIDLHGTLAQMFRRLESGPQTAEDLTSGLSGARLDDALETIADLTSRGILCDARMSPLEQYLAFSESGASALSESTVTLVGTGPVGSRIADGLREHGIDRLTVVGTDEIVAGRPAADLVIVALERLDIRVSHIANRICLRERQPWLHAALDGARGLVGPLFVPGRTACYNDLDALTQALAPAPLVEREYRRHELASRPTRATGLPVGASIVAGHATLAAVHFLLRRSCFAVGRLMTIDLDRMRIDVEDVLRLPRCPVCGDLRPAARAQFPIDVMLAPPAVDA